MNNLEIEHSAMVAALIKPGDDIVCELTPKQADLLHMAVGVSGEAGELLDAVKKATVYQKPIDRANVVEELGDLEFYMQGIRRNLGISREETLEGNLNKLLTGPKARYARGHCSNEQAQVRADKV